MKSQLASCSNIILTHSLDQIEPILNVNPHQGTINSVIWNHNSNVLASCGNDGKIILQHSELGKVLYQIDDPNNKTNPINSIDFTSNSQFLAAGCDDGKVKIFDLRVKQLDYYFDQHMSPIQTVDWNNTDEIIASGSLSEIILFNYLQKTTILRLPITQNKKGIKMLKFSKQAPNQLASASNEGFVNVWDLNKGQQVAEFKAHNAKTTAISYSPYNHILLCSAGLDKKINFYDIQEKKVVKTLNTDQPLTSLAFYNDGHTIVAGTLHGQINVYDLRQGAKVENILVGHQKQVNFLDFVQNQNTNIQSDSNLSRQSQQNSDRKSNSSLVNNSQTSLFSQPDDQNLKQFKNKVNLQYSPISQVSQVSQISSNQFQLNSEMLNFGKNDDIKSQRINTIQDIKKELDSQQGILKNNLKENNLNQARQQQSQSPLPQRFVEKGINNGNNQNFNNNFKFMPETEIFQQNQLGVSPKPNQQNVQNKKYLMEENSISSNKNESILASQTLKNNKIEESNVKQIQQNDLIFTKKQENNLNLQKTNYENNEIKISNNNHFSSNSSNNLSNPEFQKFLKNHENELKDYIGQQVQNLQIEMIRQFQIQENQIRQILDSSLAQNKQQQEKIKQLEMENKALKKINH